MLEKTEGKRKRERQRRRFDGINDSMDVESEQTQGDSGTEEPGDAELQWSMYTLSIFETLHIQDI